MTTRLFLLLLLATLARALLAHGCAELLRLALDYFAPRVPPILCGAIGLVLGAIIVEGCALLWHRRVK
jgi:hypothetical protein